MDGKDTAPARTSSRGPTVDTLRRMLKARGLPSSGRRDDLLARLSAADASQLVVATTALASSSSSSSPSSSSSSSSSSRKFTIEVTHETRTRPTSPTSPTPIEDEVVSQQPLLKDCSSVSLILAQPLQGRTHQVESISDSEENKTNATYVLRYYSFIYLFLT